MPRSIRQLRAEGRKRLLESWLGNDSYLAQSRTNSALDVDVLLSFVTGIDRVGLLTESEQEIDDTLATQFLKLIERRAAHEPVAYLTGVREFYGRDFVVSPAVLIPRPETELLVECAVRTLNDLLASAAHGILFLDIGTGSGAILLTTLLEVAARHGEAALSRIIAVGVDLSHDALAIATQNLHRLGCSQQNVWFVQGDLLSAVSELPNFDALLIVSNPPYIESAAVLPLDVACFEPALALFGGEQGLDLIAELIAQSFRRLSQIPGALLFEIGSGQADKVVSLLPECPAHVSQLLEDLHGVRRVCAVQVGI